MPKRKAVGDKRTISLPPGLQKRMAKYPEVNWSSVAAEAFEKRLNELSQQKEVKAMAGMIERLRASKERAISENYTAGRNAGEEWAEKAAEFAELQRLEKFMVEDQQRGGQLLATSESSNFTSGDVLASAVMTTAEANQQATPEEIEEFWDIAIGPGEEQEEQRANDDFVRGFADGALSAFNRVKSHL